MHGPGQILQYCRGRNGKGASASPAVTAGERKKSSGECQKFWLPYDGADEMQGRDSALKGGKSFICLAFLARQEKSKRNCDSLSPSKTFLPYSANVKGFRMGLHSLLSPFTLLESLNLTFPARIRSLVCSPGWTIAFSWTIRELCFNSPSGSGTKLECCLSKVFRRNQLPTLPLFWIVIL